MTDHAGLIEIFTSIQGEGRYAGVKQLFIRFAGCNLACGFCDTPSSRVVPGMWAYEKAQGAGPAILLPNPASATKLGRVVAESTDGMEKTYHSVSITGGEPLLQADFLKEFLPVLKRRFPVHLETNGTLPKAMARVAGLVDFVSMDIKLPSVSGAGAFWKEHRDFLKVCSKVETAVKIVVSDRVDTLEVSKAAIMISGVSRNIPVFIQPATSSDGRASELDTSTLLGIHDICRKFLRNVRVLPQAHRFMSVK